MGATNVDFALDYSLLVGCDDRSFWRRTMTVSQIVGRIARARARSDRTFRIGTKHPRIDRLNVRWSCKRRLRWSCLKNRNNPKQKYKSKIALYKFACGQNYNTISGRQVFFPFRLFVDFIIFPFVAFQLFVS